MTSGFSSEPQKADHLESAFLLNPSFALELDLISRGYHIIAGVDEAGRGALAGPLSLGLTMFSTEFIHNPDKIFLTGINDSKLLTPNKREKALAIIGSRCLLSTATMVSHRIIDSLNINGATEFALKKLLSGISIKPDIVIMDGNFKFDIGMPYMAVKKGDRKSLSIASASIAAKVARDHIMDKFEDIYPGYDFRGNKGYGTRRHCESLKLKGPCPIHRKSYEPVKSLLSLERNRIEL
ncbi:MAG: ribonuclease HII [Spirochaetae bacterium HGW-Spirochaetae-1]|jgi:ribonuclease HII|nr:MAG: ribonuclease HII [Spirochaetae bacterium HGW-Spirochaetae-1]